MLCLSIPRELDINKGNAKQFPEKSVHRVFSFKFVTYMYVLADRSNLILHIHNDYWWPEDLVCHFEMFVVGVRCELFSSTQEEHSHFEEDMATTFVEGQSVYTRFC